MRRNLNCVLSLVLASAACGGAKQPSNGIYEEEDAGGDEEKKLDAAGGKGGSAKLDAASTGGAGAKDAAPDLAVEPDAAADSALAVDLPPLMPDAMEFGNMGDPVCYLQAIVRDFSATGMTRHPDFEGSYWGTSECPGMVQETLGITGLNVTPVAKMLMAKPCAMTQNAWPQFTL